MTSETLQLIFSKLENNEKLVLTIFATFIQLVIGVIVLLPSVNAEHKDVPGFIHAKEITLYIQILVISCAVLVMIFQSIIDQPDTHLIFIVVKHIMSHYFLFVLTGIFMAYAYMIFTNRKKYISGFRKTGLNRKITHHQYMLFAQFIVSIFIMFDIPFTTYYQNAEFVVRHLMNIGLSTLNIMYMHDIIRMMSMVTYEG